MEKFVGIFRGIPTYIDDKVEKILMPESCINYIKRLQEIEQRYYRIISNLDNKIALEDLK